jgi:glycogen debranching enzyme
VAAEQLIDAGQQYYILATEVPVAERTFVLKQDETFGVFNDFGDIDAEARYEEGLYHTGTRFLSRLTLTLASHRPLLLSSTVRRDNVVMAVDLTNPDLYSGGQLVLPRGTLHLNRTKHVWNDVCYELVRVRNFSLTPVIIDIAVRFSADYADIFEVRGFRRGRRGHMLPADTGVASVTLAYQGLDDRRRRTLLRFSPAPDSLDDTTASYRLQLGSRAEKTIAIEVACATDDAVPRIIPYDESITQAAKRHGIVENLLRVETSNEQFNAWINASAADLGMLMTPTAHGFYPYAGVPWFDTTFGRDGIITALETLWLWPDASRAVLAFLAETQATEVSPERDCEPGKILHEARKGELAALGEIPFGRYYGSVDSTPLFVMLAGAYFRRTGDLAFMESLWPHITAAIAWIDRYGDSDHDGFIDYARRSASGLVHQGWKDSHDSVFHQDGLLAAGPISLCEVQGYTYAAKVAASEIAQALGRSDVAADLYEAARDLRIRFNDRYWCADIETFALALDGSHQPCRVRSSNPGHCLFTGIASDDHARAVISGFKDEHFNSGWGVRTIAEGELRYNPMAYHNGSVWPHDNAIIAAGAARYQDKALTTRIVAGLFAASTFFDLYRLPELFCGFRRREGEAPTSYPVACSPQAWAAGAVFMLMEACLGISLDANRRQILLSHPALPHGIDEVRIRGLALRDAWVDLAITRVRGAVGVSVERRSGKVEVVVQN